MDTTDDDIKEGIIDKETEISVENELEDIGNFEETGIEVEYLKGLLYNDIEAYNSTKYLINRLLLEGNDIEHINIILNEKQVEEEGSRGPLLLGAPIEATMDDEHHHDIGLPEVPSDDKIYFPEDLGEDKEFEGDPIGEETVDESEGKKEKEKAIQDASGSKRINIGRFLLYFSPPVVVIIILIFIMYNISPGLNNSSQEDFNAVFIISDMDPESGDPVFFEAYSRSVDYSYRWEIEPGDYQILDGSPDSWNITVYFKRMGTYRVGLSVTIGGRTEKHHVNLEINSYSIRVDREFFGDAGEFKIDGRIELYEVGRILPYSEFYSYDSLELDFQTYDRYPSINEISLDIVNGTGPFGEHFNQFKRHNYQKLKLIGSLVGELKPQLPVTGEIEVDQVTYIDLFNERPVSTISDQSTNLAIQMASGKTRTYEIDETIKNYPDIQRNYKELRVEKISDDRMFSPGDSGNFNWGYNRFTWNALEVVRIDDVPCVLLDIGLDEQSREKLNIDSFEMNLYLANGLPTFKKMVLNVTSTGSYSNPYSLDYSQTLTNFTRGRNLIIYGSEENRHENLIRLDQINPDISQEFHNNWTEVPKRGYQECSIPADFDAEIAYSKFKDDLDYRVFHQNRDGVFSTYSNLTRSSSGLIWKFTMAEEKDTQGWNQTVRKDLPGEGKLVNIERVDFSREEIGHILTFSGSESSVKYLLPLLDRSSALDIFGVQEPDLKNKIDLSSYSIETVSDCHYPRIGMISPTIAETLPMCYRLVSKDGTVELGLNMKNGQMSFIRESSITVY